MEAQVSHNWCNSSLLTLLPCITKMPGHHWRTLESSQSYPYEKGFHVGKGIQTLWSILDVAYSLEA